MYFSLLSILSVFCRFDSKMRTTPVIFMTLLLLVLLMLPLCLADGGNANGDPMAARRCICANAERSFALQCVIH